MGITDDVKNLLKSGELIKKFERQIELLEELIKRVKELTSTLKKTNLVIKEFIQATEKLGWENIKE